MRVGELRAHSPRAAITLRKMIVRFGISVVCLVALPMFAVGQSGVKRIQDRFLAPCCWQQSVAVHDSDIAKQMRAEIATMVAAGRNEEQIVDVYVARYGERILREPRGGYWWWSVMVPAVSIILAAAGLVMFLSRQRKQPVLAARAADLPPLPEFDLDQES